MADKNVVEGEKNKRSQAWQLISDTVAPLQRHCLLLHFTVSPPQQPGAKSCTRGHREGERNSLAHFIFPN